MVARSETTLPPRFRLGRNEPSPHFMPADTETLTDLLPTTPDLRAERLAELKRLFPDLFTDEGRLDPEEIKRLADPDNFNTPERYEFKWHGKAASKREAFKPTTATLVYDPERSVNPEIADGNMIIEGENLEVLKLLLSAYREQVKCIYIDPPYNTGKDFIYRDRYAEDRQRYWELTGIAEEGIKLESNPETSGRYHSDWLSFMNQRLLISRQLLRRDGVVLISIDDHESANLRRLADDIFGAENFIAVLVWEKGRKNDAKLFSIGHEYIFVYAKDKQLLQERSTKWREEKPGAREIWDEYLRLKDTYGDDLQSIELDLMRWFRDLPTGHPSKKLQRYRRVDEHGPWRDRDISWPGGDGPRYDVFHPETGEPCAVPERGWGFSKLEEMQRQINAGLVVFRKDHTEPPFRKAHLRPIPEELENGNDEEDEVDEDSSEDEDGELAQQVRGTYFYKQSQTAVKHLRELMGGKLFPNPKDHEEIARLIHYVCQGETGALVLDFFAGSGTTAEAVLELNRSRDTSYRFVLVQIPELVDEAKREGKAALRQNLQTISAITIERVKRVIEGYGDDPRPIPDAGFRVFKLAKSTFPRCEFAPDPRKSEAENVAALREYIAEKESVFRIDHGDEQILFDEVLLKNGFQLHYTRTRRDDFPDNEVYDVTDGRRFAIVCLDWNRPLQDSTLKRLGEIIATASADEKPFFLCLERALSTTTKWNLAQLLGDRFTAY